MPRNGRRVRSLWFTSAHVPYGRPATTPTSLMMSGSPLVRSARPLRIARAARAQSIE